VSFESIHIGVSVGFLPLGNKYSSRLHFGISNAGNGEEKGMVACTKGTQSGRKGWPQQMPKIPSVVIASGFIVEAFL
jgi:hypothetical protein